MAEHFTIGQSTEKLDRLAKIDKSVGQIQEGQVLAMNETTGKLVKYDPNVSEASGAFIVYTGCGLSEIPTEDFEDTVASFGTIVDKSKVIGIEENDYAGLHIFHDKLNCTKEEKNKLSYELEDRYIEDLKGFLTFVRDFSLKSPDDYKDSWDYIKQSTNSLSRVC